MCNLTMQPLGSGMAFISVADFEIFGREALRYMTKSVEDPSIPACPPLITLSHECAGDIFI